MSIRNTDRNVTGRLTLDPDVARRAVGAADMRALLMMVFHHTGDRYWLGERFRPVRDIRLIAPEDAGLPADVQDETDDILFRGRGRHWRTDHAESKQEELKVVQSMNHAHIPIMSSLYLMRTW